MRYALRRQTRNAAMKIARAIARGWHPGVANVSKFGSKKSLRQSYRPAITVKGAVIHA